MAQQASALKNSKSVLFCGAGISANSGIPLARELVYRILRELDISSERADLLMESSLPFEAFFETVIDTSACANELFSVFDSEHPTTNHALIAKLAKLELIHVIVTTNFDSLIEEAMKREGILESATYKRFWRED